MLFHSTLVSLSLLIALSPQKPTAKPAPKPSAKPAQAAKAPAKPVALPPNVVARVNGVDVTRDELMAYLQSTGARKVVSEMVQKTVIEKAARDAKVTVAPAEIEAKVKEEQQKIVSQMMMRGETLTFSDITKKYGLTEAEIIWGVRLNLLARKTYEKILEKQVMAIDSQTKLAHILIATIPLAPTPGAEVPTPEQQKQKDDEAKKKIDGVLAEIKAGKITFEAAAKQFSDDKSSATDGGALPWFGKGQLDPAFEKAGFALAKSGDISAPVKSQFGWHVVKLIKRGKDATPAERKAFRDDQIKQQLANPQGFQAWLEGLTRDAKITLNPSATLSGRR